MITKNVEYHLFVYIMFVITPYVLFSFVLYICGGVLEFTTQRVKEGTKNERSDEEVKCMNSELIIRSYGDERINWWGSTVAHTVLDTDTCFSKEHQLSVACCNNLSDCSRTTQPESCFLRYHVQVPDTSAIALMMEAVQTCETLVNSHQSTRRYNPEDIHLQFHLLFR
jgi:hypothetical protein